MEVMDDCRTQHIHLVVLLGMSILNEMINNFITSPPKTSIKSYTLSLACTSFDHYLFSNESSSAGSTLVASGNSRSQSILNRGSVTEIISATPPG